MAKAKREAWSDETRVLFWCPGCDEPHGPRVAGDGRKADHCWGWNQNLDRPTFTPSVKVTCEYGDGRGTRICHSFVTDGRIQFLGDSTHALAGQTVDLPDFPPDW